MIKQLFTKAGLIFSVLMFSWTASAADVGYRSVEVHIINNTQADLTIQSANSGMGQWIAGEAGRPGMVLKQYQDALLGVLTNDPDGSVLGMVTLTGLGASPIVLNFQNMSNGLSRVNVTPNDRIQGMASQISAGEANHSQFQVQLIPTMPKFPK